MHAAKINQSSMLNSACFGRRRTKKRKHTATTPTRGRTTPVTTRLDSEYMAQQYGTAVLGKADAVPRQECWYTYARTRKTSNQLHSPRGNHRGLILCREARQISYGVVVRLREGWDDERKLDLVLRMIQTEQRYKRNVVPQLDIKHAYGIFHGALTALKDDCQWKKPSWIRGPVECCSCR